MESSNSAPPPAFSLKAVQEKGAPAIKVSTPDLSGLISTPTPIEIAFQPEPPSDVLPETFKVFYGGFQIDITRRLLGVAQFSNEGVRVKEVALPPGRHKLTVQLEDSAGRVRSQRFEFEVK